MSPARTRGCALFLGISALLVMLATPRAAFAQSRIKSPGSHPHYTFDAEPHGLLGYGGPFDAPGGLVPGVGFRGTFTIVQNGFVKTINNSVGIGVGADVVFSRGGSAVLVPLVLQWNFWLSPGWSVFGEPGVGLGSGRDLVHPVFAAGGRYLFTDRVALTLRAGYPALSVGVSFLL